LKKKFAISKFFGIFRKIKKIFAAKHRKKRFEVNPESVRLTNEHHFLRSEASCQAFSERVCRKQTPKVKNHQLIFRAELPALDHLRAQERLRRKINVFLKTWLAKSIFVGDKKFHLNSKAQIFLS